MKPVLSLIVFSLMIWSHSVNATPCKSLTINHTFTVETNGQNFYSLQDQLQKILKQKFAASPQICKNGILYIFIMHTSAALTITESSEDEAKQDLLNFLDKLAPRGDQPGVSYLHHLEGPDDQPSHLKSALLQQSLAIPVEKGKLDLGQWQDIYLMEFRDLPKSRIIKLKYKAD